MQIYAHAGHNLTTGPSFFGDHTALGELYGNYETAFDQVIERMIGTGESPDPLSITVEAAKDAAGMGLTSRPQDIFSQLLIEESLLRGLVESYLQDTEVSLGTKTQLEQIASDSEDRTYKLNQRTA